MYAGVYEGHCMLVCMRVCMGVTSSCWFVGGAAERSAVEVGILGSA